VRVHTPPARDQINLLSAANKFRDVMVVRSLKYIYQHVIYIFLFTQQPNAGLFSSTPQKKPLRRRKIILRAYTHVYNASA
jgi:hypothetical protein